MKSMNRTMRVVTPLLKAVPATETAPTREQIATRHADAWHLALRGQAPAVHASTGVRIKTLQSWGSLPTDLEEPGEERRPAPTEVVEIVVRALRSVGQTEAKAFAGVAELNRALGYVAIPVEVAEPECAAVAMAGFFKQVSAVTAAAAAGMNNGCTSTERQDMSLQVRKLIQDLVTLDKVIAGGAA